MLNLIASGRLIQLKELPVKRNWVRYQRIFAFDQRYQSLIVCFRLELAYPLKQEFDDT